MIASFSARCASASARPFLRVASANYVELASQPGACVAQIARENGVNDDVIFKWLRLWQNEGRISRRLPVTTSSDAGDELLPVEITPDEPKEPMATLPLLYPLLHRAQPVPVPVKWNSTTVKRR
ncbi:transposase [Escherichia coli]|nr:transposase [Escherichia coli]